MAANYELKHRRPGRFYCFRDDCGRWAIWKGVVAGSFNTGRACDDHKAELADITREMARDWQPCPCPTCR